MAFERSDSAGYLSAHLAILPEHFRLATVSVRMRPGSAAFRPAQSENGRAEDQNADNEEAQGPESKGCLVLSNRAVAGQGLMIDGWSGRGIRSGCITRWWTWASNKRARLARKVFTN
jgi:hypothetical protein